MNFLGALGGIGGGLMASQKVLRDADEARQKKAESDLRMKAAQQGITATDKGIENDAAYAAVPTQDDRIGGFSAMAAEALKRGDKENYGKFTQYSDHLKKSKDEGVLDIAKMIYAETVNPADAESLFNNAGTMRVAPGSVKWDADTKTLSGIDARTGQPYAMTKEQAHQLLVMAGKIKPEKNEYVSGGDGTVFNKSTGEKKGTPTVKPISVAPGGTLLLPQPDGSVKKVYQAPHRPLAADGDGGLPAEAKLVDYYTKVHGMKPEDARKFVKSSKENTPESHKAKLIASVSANGRMGSAQKATAIAKGSAMIDALYGAASAPGAQPGGAQAIPPPEKREIGKAYPTPRGMMVWRGNGWSAN